MVHEIYKLANFIVFSGQKSGEYAFCNLQKMITKKWMKIDIK